MKSSESRTPCILIADDQPDVLEALRFLVKGEGYPAEAVNSPAAAIDAVESRDFDAVLMDLNYTRDTTSRAGRPGPAQPHPDARHHAAGDRDDGVGLAWNWPSKPCAAARAISSRSPGTTRGSPPF